MNRRQMLEQEYHGRINNVIHYISEHLGDTLSLETLAKVACFSQFHFHRLFTALMNETPNYFVNRLRLEKAANMLLYTPSFSKTEIAMRCGFSSSANFSRSFKQQYGMSASEWSKNCKTKSKKGKETSKRPSYLTTVKKHKKGTMTIFDPKKVEIKMLPIFHVAYVANLEGYVHEKIDAAWKKIMRWAGPRDLLNKETMYIGISFDNPEITNAHKCRYYACITVPQSIAAQKDIGVLDIPEGKHAVYRFTGRLEEIESTYLSLYSDWLQHSGYVPTDHPCFEIYSMTPNQNPKGNIVMEICLPIQPL